MKRIELRSLLAEGAVATPAGRIVRTLSERGALSATQISRLTGLAKSTVSTALSELRQLEMVVETGSETASGSVGRPATTLTLNPRAGSCIGILVGQTEIQVIVADVAHTVLADKSVHLDPDYPAETAAEVVAGLIAEAYEGQWHSPEGLLGIGIAMIQVLPILTHVQYTPRAAGGDSVGWDYATSYAFHVKEFLTVVMPQFNGVLETYWGDNGFKSHTEYLGALVVVLAVIGLGAVRRRGLLLVTLVIGGLFLLISLAADTPFYRLWYEVMPMMKSVRAAGMAFYLVALMVCIWAAHGADRLLRGEAGARTLTISLGVLGALGLLAVAGLMESMSYALADPRMVSRVAANVPEIRLGGARLLLVVIVGGGVLIAIQRRRLTGALAAGLLIAVVMLDNWSVLRHFAKWLPPAEVTYASDELIATMQQTPLPYRVLDPGGDFAGAGVYGGSILMGHKVPTLFGYHGMESRWFDDLFGTKNIWTRQLSPTLWDLYGVEYIVLNQEEPGLPGFTQVTGPVSFPNLIGRNAPAGFLYRRDVPAQWARVVPGAIQVPEDQMGATIADPGFPVNLVALFPDTSTVVGATATIAIPESTTVTASLAEWRAGKMTIALEGTDPRTTYLLVAENWYPDWRAVVDGVETPTYRANLAMIGVPIPSGAREVQLEFAMADYTAGRIITALSLLGALGLVVAGRFRRKPADV